MKPKTNSQFAAIFAIAAILSGLFSGCTPAQAIPTASPLPPTAAPPQVKPPTAITIPILIPTLIPSLTPTPIPFPSITLKKGDTYFSIDGQPGFLYSRNVAGYEPSQYYQLLAMTSTGGSKFVRIQLDSFGMGYSNDGKVDESWARKWEFVFEKAASYGIYVLPTFSAWYDWNDGKDYSTWNSNPLNEKKGGPARTALDLFTSDTPTQKMWFGWMETLVERWQGRKNILAWEIFSEINMVPGTTEPKAIDFVTRGAAIIRNADPQQRPVNASLADFGDWTGFLRSDGNDFISIHPYPVSGRLDFAILDEVRSMLATYRKPVMIGESGLSFLTPDSIPTTLTTAKGAELGIKHAIWAALVSGAMNGRSLWWEDGVAIYFPALNMPFLQKYANADLAAANFARGVDFSGFQPLAATSSPGVRGAAVGNEKMVLGWYRDTTSEPPDWKPKPSLSKQTVTLTLPGSAANWEIDFYDTGTGTDVVSSTIVTWNGNKVTITLPDFTDDIAFKMYIQK